MSEWPRSPHRTRDSYLASDSSTGNVRPPSGVGLHWAGKALSYEKRDNDALPWLTKRTSLPHPVPHVIGKLLQIHKASQVVQNLISIAFQGSLSLRLPVPARQTGPLVIDLILKLDSPDIFNVDRSDLQAIYCALHKDLLTRGTFVDRSD